MNNNKLFFFLRKFFSLPQESKQACFPFGSLKIAKDLGLVPASCSLSVGYNDRIESSFRAAICSKQASKSIESNL